MNQTQCLPRKIRGEFRLLLHTRGDHFTMCVCSSPENPTFIRPEWLAQARPIFPRLLLAIFFVVCFYYYIRFTMVMVIQDKRLGTSFCTDNSLVLNQLRFPFFMKNKLTLNIILTILKTKLLRYSVFIFFNCVCK